MSLANSFTESSWQLPKKFNMCDINSLSLIVCLTRRSFGQTGQTRTGWLGAVDVWFAHRHSQGGSALDDFLEISSAGFAALLPESTSAERRVARRSNSLIEHRNGAMLGFPCLVALPLKNQNNQTIVVRCDALFWTNKHPGSTIRLWGSSSDDVRATFGPKFLGKAVDATLKSTIWNSHCSSSKGWLKSVREYYKDRIQGACNVGWIPWNRG